LRAGNCAHTDAAIHSAMPELPTTMKRLVLSAPSMEMKQVTLTVEEVPVPVPKSGEVLIQVSAAPINPSDYGVWRFTAPEKCPMAIGNEGSGVVVASGGGMTTALWAAVGSKVGFVKLPYGQGAYSEYVVATAATGVFPMDDGPADIEQAASFFVNPYTAVGIFDTIKQMGVNGMIHTAAASQLGQMMVKLAKERGVTLINVVRRAEQAETLRALGAEHVVVSSTVGWEKELAALIADHKITVAFDAIAGETSGTLLSMLPPKGTCFVYGGLSSQPVGNINPIEMIYHKKQIKGWLLTNWLTEGGLLRTLGRLRRARKLVNPGLKAGGWAESKFVDCELETAWSRFIEMYESSGFTDRKLRIRFGSSQP